MNILKKCYLCNHHVWPWQKTSPMAGSGIHHYCHSISISIAKQNPSARRYINNEINEFERRVGRITGLNESSEKIEADENFDSGKLEMVRMINEAEDMVKAFPSQPEHKYHADELRNICKPFLDSGR